MEEKEKLSLGFENIAEIIHENSVQSSKIGRQIMLGLFATTWAFFFINGEFTRDFFLIASMLAGVFYFMIDFFQYFFISVSYRSLLKKASTLYREKENIEVVNPDKNLTDGKNATEYIIEKLQEAVITTKKEINDRSFVFFFVKFPFIFLSFIFIIAYIIQNI